MKRSLRWFRRLALLLSLPLLIVLWAYWGDAPLVPRAGDVQGHVKAVIRGEIPWHAGRSPREIIRYVERRLEGHELLQTAALPLLRIAQREVERPVPELKFPDLGKGFSNQARYTEALPTLRRIVGTAEQLREAVSEASPGDVIELLPGNYRFNHRVVTRRAGAEEHPIVVSGRDPATVVIEFASDEGFFVNQPYWIFQNLSIRGICQADSHCEHAFHVVGKARGTVIRNNRVEDFNAHIKINGAGKDWPDGGVIEFNTLTNSRLRKTDRPVTLIDLVGANDWLVADNIISNFVKGGRDRISYGVFMKGAGKDGRVERNLVLCTTKEISQAGVRVGISFGGGGTGQDFCRDKLCEKEFFNGLVANNIVAHCNDFGIDVYRSGPITVAHNTLINTAGIDVRESAASAHLYGNLVEGMVRVRNGATAKVEMNETEALSEVFLDADQLNLHWRTQPGKIPSLSSVSSDFCKRERPEGTLPGANDEELPCLRKP